MKRRPIPATGKNEEMEERALRVGMDLSLLDANLRRSPLQRIRLHDRAYQTMKSLRAAGKIAFGNI